MADYDNTNKGVIFKNDTKGNDKAPIYRGKGNFKGQDFEVAMWVKKDKNDNSYFTVAFSEPYVKDGESKTSTQPTYNNNSQIRETKIDDEQLPF